MSNKIYNILLVDDDPEWLEIATTALQSAGYLIYLATEGMEGVLEARDKKPDLIILDISMPRLDGFEVCRKLKTDPRTENIPILMLTCRSSKGDVVEAFKAGASDYLIKPVKAPLLIQKVDSLLKKSKS